jgi:hypothetical protein
MPHGQALIKPVLRPLELGNYSVLLSFRVNWLVAETLALSLIVSLQIINF